MGKTLDLGRRLELEPLDKHCQNISVALYESNVDGVPCFKPHTYSLVDSANHRIAFLTQALQIMLGLEETGDRQLRFSCGTIHERALKRAFLDLCKLETGADLAPKPLTAFDKKADGDISAISLGDGVYEMRSVTNNEAGQKRAIALSRGYAKICEMEPIEGSQVQLHFGCGHSHDALMGMLMFRAQNVRAAMQEEEQTSSRGVLSSPSQQT